MPRFREVIKRYIPKFLHTIVVRGRDILAAPPMEDIALHDYVFVADPGTRPRLSLVIPSVSPATAFGGILTGIEIVLQIGALAGVEIRIIVDHFDGCPEPNVVESCARRLGLRPTAIEILPRTEWVPRIPVRAGEVFCTFDCWTTFNTLPLLQEQSRVFGGAPRPYIYIIQEYEPLFYPMSSTHMLARAAFETDWPCWGVFNSSELYAFFTTQGHRLERSFVFEPKISGSLRPFLNGEAPVKERRILVYGRPSIPRNCFPAVTKGLACWAERHPEFAGWTVVSAGLRHAPITFAPGRAMNSLGKLALEDYAMLLRGSAVGLSLMASPHPSYPPLEMAHFGIRTVTNRYANKDLSDSHANILSIRDVSPATIADGLARACRAFEADPGAAWRAPSYRPSFLEAGSFGFLDELAHALNDEVCNSKQVATQSSAQAMSASVSRM